MAEGTRPGIDPATNAALDAADSGLHTHIESQITGLSADLAARELSANKDIANGYAGLTASSLLKVAEMPAFTGDVTSSPGSVTLTVGQLTRLAIGGAASTGTLLHVGANAGVANRDLVLFSGTVNATAFGEIVGIRGGTINAAAGQNASTLFVDGTLVVAATGTHALLTGVRISAPTITTGAGGTVTEAATLYLGGSPSGATTNYTLHSTGGLAQFDGTLTVGGGAVKTTNTFGSLALHQGTGSVVAYRWTLSNDNTMILQHSTDSFGTVANTPLQFSGNSIGFFGTTPQAKPTGVAVSAAGVHAALVTLGLIAP